jgi:hypothetical protein
VVVDRDQAQARGGGDDLLGALACQLAYPGVVADPDQAVAQPQQGGIAPPGR